MVACNLAHFSTLMGHFHGSGLLYDVMQEKESVAPLHLEDGLSELKPTASPSKLTHMDWKSKHTLFSPTLHQARGEVKHQHHSYSAEEAVHRSRLSFY